MMQIAAVVTQPGRPRSRGNRKTPQPSIVAEKALALGYAEDQILSPVKAREVCPSELFWLTSCVSATSRRQHLPQDGGPLDTHLSCIAGKLG